MAFFLMGIMGLCFILLSGSITGLSLYKQGKLLEKKWLFILVTGVLLLELGIAFSSLPSNYLIQRGITIAFMAVVVGNIFLQKKSFNASRLVLGVMSILTLFALFML